MTRTERQLEGIEKWKKAGCKATLNYCTGVGKTYTSVMAIQRVRKAFPQTKVVIIVPTKVLKDQWEDNLLRYDLTDVDVKIINSAVKQPFGCNFLILDECHLYNSDVFAKVFEVTKPKLILGLTATYERLDGKEKEIMDKYCPVCDVITVTEATKNNWLSPYKEYKVLLDVDLTDYNKSNINFMNHFAFFNYSFDDCMKCVTDFWYQQKIAKQLNCPVNDVKMHAYQWNKALRERKAFIANHPKKIEIAKKILEARPNAKAITFNSSIKQCEAYGFGYVAHSGNTKKANALTMEEFGKVKTGVIHSSKMLLTGVDVKGLNLAIVTGFNSSKTNRVQLTGRCIRFEPNKQSELFTLILKGTQEEKWYQKSMEGLPYIEITESELDEILQGNSLINKKEITQEKTKNLFRF